MTRFPNPKKSCLTHAQRAAWLHIMEYSVKVQRAAYFERALVCPGFVSPQILAALVRKGWLKAISAQMEVL